MKNLVRRRVVIASEGGCQYQGKTAVEWAKVHCEMKMAAELCYFWGLAVEPHTNNDKIVAEFDKKIEELRLSSRNEIDALRANFESRMDNSDRQNAKETSDLKATVETLRSEATKAAEHLTEQAAMVNQGMQELEKKVDDKDKDALEQRVNKLEKELEKSEKEREKSEKEIQLWKSMYFELRDDGDEGPSSKGKRK